MFCHSDYGYSEIADDISESAVPSVTKTSTTTTIVSDLKSDTSGTSIGISVADNLESTSVDSVQNIVITPVNQTEGAVNGNNHSVHRDSRIKPELEQCVHKVSTLFSTEGHLLLLDSEIRPFISRSPVSDRNMQSSYYEKQTCSAYY